MEGLRIGRKVAAASLVVGVSAVAIEGCSLDSGYSAKVRELY